MANSNLVNTYLAQVSSKLPEEAIPALRTQLEGLDDARVQALLSVELKDPTMMFIISFLVGTLGIDRFMIGDTGLGIAKLLTGGGCLCWALVDLFLIMGATRKKNLAKVQQALLF